MRLSRVFHDLINALLTDGRMDGPTDQPTDRLTDEPMDRLMVGWTDGLSNGHALLKMRGHILRRNLRHLADL